MLKDCFGTLRDKDDCFTCEKNYDCFIKTMKGEQCFIEANSNLNRNCNLTHCTVSETFKIACRNVRKILLYKEKCLQFSEKKKDIIQIEKCLKCDSFLYIHCMNFQIIRKKGLMESAETIQNELSFQIEEMKKEDGTCFGLPQFEKSCWNCDFLLACKRKAGIGPGSECFFAKTKENDICATCPFVKSCENLLKEEIKEKKEEEKKKEMFKTFYDLSTIRNIARTR